MLTHLRIRDLAIVDDATLDLRPGLLALTGETGAGKSLIVDAISLLIGERADATLVRTGAARAVVEGTFLGMSPAARALLHDAGILEGDDPAVDAEVLVRREITADGRSRAWINDRTVTLTTLRALGQETLELCGQHAHQSLLRRATHLDLLDQFAQASAQRRAVADAVREVTELREAWESRARARADASSRREFVLYQIAEIDRIAPVAGEDAELQRERDILRHAAHLAGGLAEVLRLLDDEGDGAGASRAVARAVRVLTELADVDPRLAVPLAGVRDAHVALDEAARDLAAAAAALTADPARLEEVEARLHALHGLAMRHGGSLDAVLAHREALEGERAVLDGDPRDDDELREAFAAAERALHAHAADLSAIRRRAAEPFAHAIVEAAASLGLPGARLAVQFESHDAIGERGAEDAELLFAANVGEDLRPLVRVASGGELSRLLLAVRTVLRQSDTAHTLVFDEVDQGIGGHVADAVARRVQEVSADTQVLAITHLAVLAARADAQWVVEKSVDGQRTRVRVAEVTGDARVEELARMLTGAAATQEARAHARALLAGASAPPAARARKAPTPRTRATARPISGDKSHV